MESNFPPKTSHQDEIELLLNVLGSVVPAHSAAYASTPITSGRRYANWSNSRNVEIDLSDPETYQEFLHEVLEPNSEHARFIIAKLRDLFPTLIDPTALKDIEGWVQDDYRVLWARVIDRYANTVVFLDGWQYSNGCAYEYLISNQLEIKALNETLEPLRLEDGIRLVTSAIQEFQVSGLPTDFLQQVRKALTRLLASKEALAEA